MNYLAVTGDLPFPIAFGIVMGSFVVYVAFYLASKRKK
ncbi:hypothetical protein J2S35_000794 [Falsarthrobacter nasiphocae]|uniref:Uncharacterized protein n=1 Tax=Falsarthrobacter nasiphocae TaxID=189863 RepID=A0AAE3YED5_9MICC|nr:hypothetical protein [Falsarthrobacter nasiphocae]